jgi:hypothetical protein
MARLYRHCAICSRRQADGLLSGALWGKVELPAGMRSDHPAVSNGVANACPSCVGSHSDWRERTLVALGVAPSTGPGAPLGKMRL